jgi:4-amino-4-deoxy-L-arabinose transferase-like glycosyltransferase
MNDAREPGTAKYYIGILIISALLFIPFLGQVHLFDWDEINFAESAREMISSHDYLTVQINYIPFWEKPPLFIWMQVMSMKAFGINEFAARLPNAICGIITLLLLFQIGSRLVDKRFGLTLTVLYGGSILPFLYFKSGIIDPWFNLFIFLGIYRFYKYIVLENARTLNLIASAFFIGLGILTKGPVALLIFMITTGIYLIIRRFKIRIRPADIPLFLLVLILVGGLWFILQIIRGNFGIIRDFMEYQVRLFRTQGAGHGGFLFYHFVVLLFGVFPASLLALPALFGSKAGDGNKKEFLRWMTILFWVVLLLFTIVRTKIVHYSSLCYFPLAFISAWWLYYSDPASNKGGGLIRLLVIATGSFLALIVAALTYIDRYKDDLIGMNLIRDPFALACLKTDAGWHGYEPFVAVVLLTGIAWFAILWKRNRFRAICILTGFVSAFMFLSMYLVAPRIEMYSQRPALEFFESVSGQDAYLLTLGYKSYAQLFYGKARDHDNKLFRDEKWLLTGNIDKPVFLAAKSNTAGEYLAEYPDLVLLYEKNGFAFFKRIPKSNP